MVVDVASVKGKVRRGTEWIYCYKRASKCLMSCKGISGMSWGLQRGTYQVMERKPLSKGQKLGTIRGGVSEDTERKR